MDIGTLMGVIAGMHGADHAGQRLAKGSGIEARTLVREQTPHLHHLGRDDDVGGVATDESVGIARGGKGSDRTALIVKGRLDGELVTRLELILPPGADLDDLSGELVADDRRILGDVIRHPLVVGGLMGGLVGRHAEAVADNLREDLIILHHGEFELFETKVFLTI